MSDIDNVSWNYPTPIWFGLGRSLEIPNALEAQGMQNPLVVTDPEFTSNKNFIKIIELIKNNKIKHSIFSNIKGNPTGKNVMDGVEHYLSNNNDGVIAIGGGSSLDAGKAIAFMTKQKENLWFFEDIGDNWTRAITDQLPKVIAIPTNLTLSLPPHLTAATGMDALAHCLEAYCARGFHPMADGIALEGIKNVKDSLLSAYKNPDDIFARSKMLVTSSMGSTAFQKGLGAIHSLSHPINAVNDIHHGLSNAIFMPYVLKFNEPIISQRIQLLTKYLELENSSFDGFMSWILKLRDELAIPHTLKELNQEFDFELLSEMALKDPSTGPNPRDISLDEMKQLYINSYEGIL